MIDRTTDGLEGVFAYMDDLRVGSPDRQTHLRHLEAFFTALATNGLAINLEKCVFAALLLTFLDTQFRRRDQPLFAYMDDSQVGSLDRQTHLRHLEAFFTALATNGLAINLEKCVFAAPLLTFLDTRFR
jgi:hypothetical protein